MLSTYDTLQSLLCNSYECLSSTQGPGPARDRLHLRMLTEMSFVCSTYLLSTPTLVDEIKIIFMINSTLLSHLHRLLLYLIEMLDSDPGSTVGANV